MKGRSNNIRYVIVKSEQELWIDGSCQDSTLNIYQNAFINLFFCPRFQLSDDSTICSDVV